MSVPKSAAFKSRLHSTFKNDAARNLRAFVFPTLILLAALVLAACAPGGQFSPANPGGGEAPSEPNTPAPARATRTPDDPSSIPAASTPMDDDTVTIDLTNPAPPNQLPLPAGRTRIYGRVVDPQGAPVSGAAVTIPRGTSPVPERAALTDENGNYNWVLLPGIYTVQVNATGFQSAQADGNTQQQSQVELNFTLKPE